MNIEIRKAGFVNKGAALMLHAATAQLRANYPLARLVMAPTKPNALQSMKQSVQNGYCIKPSLYRCGVQWGHLAGLVPRILRSRYGVVLDRELDVVVDAAGFAYSDQWGVRNSHELALASTRWRRQGTTIVLLPQAFGPFHNHDIRLHIRKIVANADLIMARDQVSYDHLTAVVGQSANIQQFPDFTNLVEGEVPPRFDADMHRVCLVPNCRMLDKTQDGSSSSYLPFMIQCAKLLRKRRANPFILVHEGKNDLLLAQRISEASGGIPILKEEDPIAIKGILRASHATIGSRFHGLVSALSQGVPALATGWSHKYIELFREYGVPEFVLSPGAPAAEVQDKIAQIIEQSSNKEMRLGLLRHSQRLKRKSEEMWEIVFRAVDHGRTWR